MLAAIYAEGGLTEEGVPPRGGAAPQLPRWYETAALDVHGTGGGFRILVLPPTPEVVALRELGAIRTEGLAQTAAVDLDLVPELDVSAEELLSALLVTRPDGARSYRGSLRAHYPVKHDQLIPEELGEFAAFASDLDPALASFAARVATEPLVPVEHSAAQGISLNHLMHSGGASAVLAYAMATGDPVLVIEYAGALVLVGGARGVSAALEEGLYQKVLRWLTGESPDDDDDDHGTQGNVKG